MVLRHTPSAACRHARRWGQLQHRFRSPGCERYGCLRSRTGNPVLAYSQMVASVSSTSGSAAKASAISAKSEASFIGALQGLMASHGRRCAEGPPTESHCGPHVNAQPNLGELEERGAALGAPWGQTMRHPSVRTAGHPAGRLPSETAPAWVWGTIWLTIEPGGIVQNPRIAFQHHSRCGGTPTTQGDRGRGLAGSGVPDAPA